jgi:hypothetical protein
MAIAEAEKRFAKAVAARRGLEGLRVQRRGLVASLQGTLDELNVLAERRSKERTDVEALKAVNIISLVEMLMGVHAKKLAKEERELAAAELAMREADEQLNAAR